ncbi:MAG: twin transmembrane helix small protein [Pigmentiphaga sp.]|nr:twin transmembrane helix small protein [Pigmentiphaga sp.]
MRLVIIIAMIGILYSLASAMFHMIKHKDHSKQMAWSLTVRIGLSIALFIFVLVAHALGWIESTGL